MKSYILIFFLFFLQLNAQQKLTYQNDIEIYYLGNEVSQQEILNGKFSCNFKIINNTQQTLLINKFGFENNNYVTQNNEFVEPSTKFLDGFPADLDLNECKENILVLEPKSEIEIPYLNIFFQKNVYKIDSNKNYKLVLISKQYPSYSKMRLQGCENYIEELEKQGKKIANIHIVTEIPLVK